MFAGGTRSVGIFDIEMFVFGTYKENVLFTFSVYLFVRMMELLSSNISSSLVVTDGHTASPSQQQSPVVTTDDSRQPVKKQQQSGPSPMTKTALLEARRKAAATETAL